MAKGKEITNEQIEADILHKLHRKRKWGAAHTAFEHLYKWCEQKYTKRYKSAAKKLIKENLVISKPTSYGLQVSLNPERRDEIIKIIRKSFEN